MGHKPRKKNRKTSFREKWWIGTNQLKKHGGTRWRNKKKLSEFIREERRSNSQISRAARGVQGRTVGLAPTQSE